MNDSDNQVASFGQFRLSLDKREIRRNGVPLALGDRALDILIALVERPGEIVSHRDLIARVWRNLVVSPGNLRVHMSALRKALGDGEGGTRYIENVTGQGYCFVAPITREAAEREPVRSPQTPAATRKGLALPRRLSRMIGRAQVVDTIRADVVASRFVTIIGPGGMGKTTVAIAVAHELLEEFSAAVCFIDIGAIADPALVAATLASSLGLSVQTADVVPFLVDHLRTLRILLVLDNCEHAIDTVAPLAERIFREASGVHILATSREGLRVDGENGYWLPPLAGPPPQADLKAADVLAFPAIQLFIERAIAAGGRFDLNDENAPIIAGICGRLDGLALAIELAAGRAGTYGIGATADLLNRNIGIDWPGQRTAHPRHQTLRALLNWSYEYLSEEEQLALRRLSLLVGDFSVEAANAIVHGRDKAAASTFDHLDALVTRSLASAQIADDGTVRYRLLDTTRMYALEKLQTGGDAPLTARRHAEYFLMLLNASQSGLLDVEHTSAVHPLREHLGNIRAALHWCFPGDGPAPDATLAVDLAAAAAPMLLELSLLNEACQWSAAGLALLDESTRGSRREMLLQGTWAISSMWISGNRDEVLVAIARALDLAYELHEPHQRLRMLVTKHVILTRCANFRGALAAAQESHAAATQVPDVSSLPISELIQGVAWHFVGDQAAARRYIEMGFSKVSDRPLPLCGNDHRVRALVVLSRVLWLSGFPEQAMATARKAVWTAKRSGKPLDTCFALIFSTPVYLWSGDWGAAQDSLDQLAQQTNWPMLKPFHSSAAALRGALLISRNDPQRGIETIEEAIPQIRANRQNNINASAACWLAIGLANVGKFDEAYQVVRTARRDGVRSAEGMVLPELLRIQAQILVALSPANQARAARLLMRACRVARRQSALSWELRAAMDLSRLRTGQDGCGHARSLLATTYRSFSEGFATADLRAAAQLLHQFDGADSAQDLTGRISCQ